MFRVACAVGACAKLQLPAGSVPGRVPKLRFRGRHYCGGPRWASGGNTAAGPCPFRVRHAPRHHHFATVHEKVPSRTSLIEGAVGDAGSIHQKPERDLHGCPAWTARVAASTVGVVSSRVLFLGFLAAVDYGQRGGRYPRRVASSREPAKLPGRGVLQCREGPVFVSSGEFSLVFWDVVLVARLVCRAVPSAWRESSQAWVWRWGQMCWVGTGGYGLLFTVAGCTLQAVYW